MMKKNKALSLGLISLTALGLGVQTTQAATTLPVETEGKVQLTDTWEEGGIINPPTTGPETVDPDKEVPPAGDRDLAIVYYPTFDFGDQNYDGTQVTYLAKAFKGTIQNSENEENNGKETILPQFVQVRNSSSISKWSLQVAATEFLPNNSTDAAPLKGAEITIKDIAVQNNVVGGGAATAAGGAIKLSDSAQTIGQYNVADQTGISRNSFMFGDVIDGEDNTGAQKLSSGVELMIPANLDITDDGGYTAVLTWSLADTE